jgi:hypothetical protein
MNSTKSLNILKFVEMDAEISTSKSWVPDWSLKRHTEDCLEPFLAGGISSACASFEEGGTLRVSGRKIGEIELVVESFQLGEFKHEQIVPEVARFNHPELGINLPFWDIFRTSSYRRAHEMTVDKVNEYFARSWVLQITSSGIIPRNLFRTLHYYKT